MAIKEFGRTFGVSQSAAQSQDEGRAELPKAQIWVNIGYRVELPSVDGKGTETRFISIPVGIPLDTQKPIDIRVRNADMADMQAHQNLLLEELQALAGQLDAGDETYLNGLEIQMRRVKDPVTAPVASASSPFARKSGLVAEVKAEAPSIKGK